MVQHTLIKERYPVSRSHDRKLLNRKASKHDHNLLSFIRNEKLSCGYLRLWFSCTRNWYHIEMWSKLEFGISRERTYIIFFRCMANLFWWVDKWLHLEYLVWIIAFALLFLWSGFRFFHSTSFFHYLLHNVLGSIRLS